MGVYWKFLKENWKEISPFVGGTLIPVFIMLWKRVLRKKFSRWRLILTALARLPEIVEEHMTMQTEFARLGALPGQVEEVIRQLSPNGGTSIADSLKRVENGLYEMRVVRWAYEDIAGSPFLQANSKGEIIAASRGLCDTLGLDAKDILLNGWVSAIHPDDRTRIWQEWRNAVDQQRRFDETFRVVRADDHRTVKVNAKANPVRDADNRLTGFVGAITEAVAQGGGGMESVRD